ncbi:MAG: osmoprotectant NAGGN system M42 family peptidase [Spongiibacteraceae bacterium]|jgi:peptidase M42 family hydrolase|nr:osmoprotectant NAGGN system M42 family peptidase [Spongiibacteraceae bacterium]
MTVASEPPIDAEFLRARLLEMLAVPSPTGFTDEISRYVCGQLELLAIPYELTRRGTIIAKLAGRSSSSARAVVNHIDTIGATVTGFNPNGRLRLAPVGTWSSRFAEGGKVTVFTAKGAFRGQVLPLLASGHAFNEKVDELPVGWPQVELRLNEPVFSDRDARALGVASGDFVAFDADPEVADNGYICARHLDNKAGAAALLTALKALRDNNCQPAVDLHALFTVTEEIGTGASASLADYITEFVGIDIGPVARGQNARETGVTLCAQDTSGPFDYHMLQRLKALCRQYGIPYQIDVFRYYYSDANSAIKAGHDVRDALMTFGTDATHGYERTHFDSLESVARLLSVYALSEPVHPLLRSDLAAFPHTPEQPVR